MRQLHIYRDLMTGRLRIAPRRNMLIRSPIPRKGVRFSLRHHTLSLNLCRVPQAQAAPWTARRTEENSPGPHATLSRDRRREQEARKDPENAGREGEEAARGDRAREGRKGAQRALRAPAALGVERLHKAASPFTQARSVVLVEYNVRYGKSLTKKKYDDQQLLHPLGA